MKNAELEELKKIRKELEEIKERMDAPVIVPYYPPVFDWPRYYRYSPWPPGTIFCGTGDPLPPTGYTISTGAGSISISTVPDSTGTRSDTKTPWNCGETPTA